MFFAREVLLCIVQFVVARTRRFGGKLAKYVTDGTDPETESCAGIASVLASLENIDYTLKHYKTWKLFYKHVAIFFTSLPPLPEN